MGLYDIDPSKTDAYRHLLAASGKTYSQLQDCLNAPLDAIIVCTPDFAHAEIAFPALNAGKYVFLEKPLEITEEKCRTIIDADQAVGNKTFVGFNLRYAPVYGKMQNLIREGKIGQILTIEANEFYIGGRTYFRRWNRLRKFGGGLWITKACHDFDLLYWMAGCRPLSVCAFDALTHYRNQEDATALCRDCDRNKTCDDSYFKKLSEKEATDLLQGEARPDLCLFNAEKDTFDHGSALIRFENNITATYTCNVVSSFDNREMRVSGTTGCLEGDLKKQQVIYRERFSNKEEVIDLSNSADGAHGGADKFILDGFADFVEGKPVSIVKPEEAMVSVRMGLAATQSSDEKRIIDL
jgi:predicted dehydrogenase